MNFLKSHHRIIYALAALLCAAILFAIFAKPAQNHAAEIIDECADTQGERRAECYEKLVPALYPKLSPEDVFSIIRDIRTQDGSYQFCHVLAHKVGERVVAEDPAKWLDAIPVNPPDGLCSNGFIHGVVTERFRAEVLDEKTLTKLIPDFARACEPRNSWDPTDLDKAMCYHGLGHLYDFITNADIPRALDLCSKTAGTQFQRVCIEGVFMQIFQPLEPDDFALIEQMKNKPTAENVRTFCSGYREPEYVGACLRESWPLHPGMTDGSGIIGLCKNQPNAEEEHNCYQAALAILGRQSQASIPSLLEACTRIPKEWRQMCYVVGAGTFIEEDRVSGSAKAVLVCTGAEEEYRDQCILALIDRMRFNFGSHTDEARNFCESLPSGYRSLCPIP